MLAYVMMISIFCLRSCLCCQESYMPSSPNLGRADCLQPWSLTLSFMAIYSLCHKSGKLHHMIGILAHDMQRMKYNLQTAPSAKYLHISGLILRGTVSENDAEEGPLGCFVQMSLTGTAHLMASSPQSPTAETLQVSNFTVCLSKVK